MKKKRQKRTQWHPGFCSAVRLELRDNREELDYTNEYNLNRKPIQIDLLVVKKTADIVLENEIGKIFREHNIMEYKSPQDDLNIDTYFKGLAYACLYKAAGGTVNAIPAEEITVTYVWSGKPVKLLRELQKKGRTVRQTSNGIYYIGEAWFDVQIIVTSQLDETNHLWLKSLTEQMTHAEAERLVCEVNALERKDEKDFAESVLEVAMAANIKAFGQIKEGANMMFDALRELMEPEIEAELEATRKQVTEEVTQQVTQQVTETVETKERLTIIKNIMKNSKTDAMTAMSVMGLTEQDQKKYLAML